MRDQTVIGVNVPFKMFFVAWLRLTNSSRELRENEIAVLAALLAVRHSLSMYITNDELLDRILFSSEGRGLMLKELPGYNAPRLSTALGCLRKKGCILEGNRVNRSAIPDYTGKSNRFDLSFILHIKHEEEEVPGQGGQTVNESNQSTSQINQDAEDTTTFGGSL
jgi:hypothetical protein